MVTEGHVGEVKMLGYVVEPREPLGHWRRGGERAIEHAIFTQKFHACFLLFI